MKQRIDEWYAARLGKVTASKISDVVSFRKSDGKETEARRKYKGELICERLTGIPTKTPFSKAMQRGISEESSAIQVYGFNQLCLVDEVGFVQHKTIEFSGASPDGLVDEDGLVECKCPEVMTHINFLRHRKIKPQYIDQMQWQMECCGRDWCDFVSYDDRFPEELSYCCERVHRDQERIFELTKGVNVFLEEVQSEIGFLKNLKN